MPAKMKSIAAQSPLYLMRGILLLVLLTAAFAGCALDGKENYVEKYGSFVAEVEEHGADYTDADWVRADQQFRLYSDVYWEKYRDQLTAVEQQRVNDYALLYQKCRVAVEWEKILNTSCEIQVTTE